MTVCASCLARPAAIAAFAPVVARRHALAAVVAPLAVGALGLLGACASVRPRGATHDPSATHPHDASAASADTTGTHRVVADRQAYTEGADILGGGWLQVEAGDRYRHHEGRREGPVDARGQADEADDEDANTAGEVLVRVAAGRRAEVRVGLGSLVRTTAGGEHQTGRTDGQLGVKLLLAPEAHALAWRPAAALVLATSVPTGSPTFKHARVDPEAKLALGWTLPRDWELGSNVNVARLHERDAPTRTEWAYSVAVSHPVAGPVRGIAEAFTRRPPHGDARSFLATGAAVAVGRTYELDAEIGRGIGAARRDYFVSVGGARRW